jgi:hypothetical protein
MLRGVAVGTSAIKLRTLLVVLATALSLVLAGCLEPAGTSAGSAPGPGTTAAPQPPSDCSAARGKAGALLPPEDDVFRDVSTNPCIPLAELADLVLQLIPAGAEDATPARRARFQETVARVSGPLLKTAGHALSADGVARCGYETDHLAIRFYQQADPYPWSVGAAAVIRGDIDAAADITVCYLKGLLPQFAPPSRGVTAPEPVWSPCARSSRPTHRGEVFTVIIAGTSDQMCGYLAQAL